MLKKLIIKHWLLTLIVMSIAAIVLGISSYNLFFLFKANLTFIADYGWQAVADGALQQLAELCVYGFFSIVAYVIFKACEKVLVELILK